ncbi:response regulator [Candidatus Kaiserbacteria bacterium]|nr:response regulator [Candidatus Kaiserbacteria bacterium]
MTSEQKKKILVIEDDSIIARLLEHRLTRSGYEVAVESNGKTGLEAIASKRPDLVLLDIVLPEMDGFAVLRELNEKKITPALPVVVISNSGQPVEVDRILDMGACDYLVKVNFSPQGVLEKVKKCLSHNY